ncbi:MAG: hypothetical protein IKH13_01440 [Clostridia bacterium]|nr:hypothetical protein [Clostridia bacterium]
MKQKYNEEIKKIKLSETDFYSEREKIENGKAGAAKTKYVSFKPVVAAASIVLIIAVAFCFPQVRSFSYDKMKTIKYMLTFSDGTKGELEIAEDYTAISFEEVAEANFFSVEEGKLYFEFEGMHDDITDTVKKDGYFRFEITRENGKSVLFIGGEEGKYGWCELVFDKDGKYITNRMNVPAAVADNSGNNAEETVEGNPKWLDEALSNEGVPTGNPEYDFKKEKE